MASRVFEIGDLVWAKKKGFTAWPGKIIEPLPDAKPTSEKKPKHYVSFFGSDDHAWINDDQIWSYAEHRSEFRPSAPSHSTPTLDDAIEKIEAIIGPEVLAQFANISDPNSRVATTVSNVDSATEVSGKLRRRPSIPTNSIDSSTLPSSNKRSRPSMSPATNGTAHLIRNKSLPSSTETKIVKQKKSISDIVKSVTPSTSLLPDILTTPSSMVGCPPPSQKMSVKIGFIGLGKLGSVIVRCLLESGHDVTVWNRTPSKCREFVALGADKGISPADVVQTCDITISCLSDSRAVKDLVCGKDGLLQDMGPGKSFVDMSTVDTVTISEIHEAVTLRGGRFLEAPIIGSLNADPPGSKQLIVVASGEVGSATALKLVTNMLLGTMMAGIAETLALGEKVGLKQEQILHILSLLSADCPLFRQKGNAMVHNEFNPPQLAIDDMQRNLRFAIGLAESVEQSVHVTSATNELFKRAKSRGYGDHDTAAIYRATE